MILLINGLYALHKALGKYTMKILFVPFLFSMFAMAFSSCQSNSAHTGLIFEIDSTLVSLEDARVILDEVNLAEAAKMLIKFDSLNGLAMAQFDPADTAQYWRTEIGDLQFCSKSMSKYLNEEQHIRQEVNFTIKQLTTLKADLANHLIPEDKVEEYSGIELHSAALILRKSSKRTAWALQCYSNFNSIMAKADSIYKTQILIP